MFFRATFGEGRTLKDFGCLFVIVFGKKVLFDIVYYQIHPQKYLRYIGTLIFVDYCLLLLSKKNIKTKQISKIQPLKIFLLLASGISDSISLENLLYRNQLPTWHLPVVFLFGNCQAIVVIICIIVLLDPVIYTGFTWVMKAMKKDKCKYALKKGLLFGVLLTLAHFVCSRDNYSNLVDFRKMIPFHSSNMLTDSVGIRLLNCLGYLMLIVYELARDPSTDVAQIFIKDNFLKMKPAKKILDSSISTQASSDEESSIGGTSLMIERTKSE